MSNGVRQIAPMLAKSVDKQKLERLMNDSTVVAEEKIDGERNLLHVMPDGSARITSRRISKQTGRYADKSRHIPHITLRGIWPAELAGTIFDGEMTHPQGFKMTAGVFRSLPERAIELQQKHGLMEYIVFDVLSIKGQDVMGLSWLDRRMLLERYLPGNVRSVSPSWYEQEKKQDLLDDVWRRGGEGVILKPMRQPYVPGNRSVWVKVKAELTEDVVVLGYAEADMEYTGKYPETWPLWAYLSDGMWKRCSASLAAEMLSKGVPVKPVNSSWWKRRVAGIRYGQYVDLKTWERIGSPARFELTFIDSRPHVLVEMGQTGPGDVAMIEEVTANQEQFLGRVMEIKANGRFEDTGKFRHPVFVRWRDDKNAEECLWMNGGQMNESR